MDKVVAVHVDLSESKASVWVREDRMLVANKVDIDFRPWFVAETPSGQAKCRKLRGNNALKWLRLYTSVRHYQDQLAKIPFDRVLSYDDPNTQFLVLNPEYCLFQGMPFEQLNRLVLDIEASGIGEENKILLVAIKSDTLGELVLEGCERDIITRLNEIIQLSDCDTIEGHNIFGFDIPFLARRAAVHGLTLDWGRNGEPVVKGPVQNFRVGSTTRSVQTWKVVGRHFVDSMLIAQRYDSNIGGVFESYSLKYLEQYFGLVDDDRLVLDTANMSELWENEHDSVCEYALQDVRGCYQIIEKMVQPEFYLATIVPDTFQNILLSGNAYKSNQILVSKYLDAGHSIPLPVRIDTEYPGAHVELCESGVFDNVVKIDVTSLYPSIMLNVPEARPASDELGAFYETLLDLTNRRIATKKEAKKASGEQKKYLEGIEKSFKIIINAFYGYLGTNYMNFADVSAAAKVAETGREIVTDMAEQLRAMGCRLIEIDTDGIYFCLPPGVSDVDKIVNSLVLHDWISLDSECYSKMLAIKAKNYVLVKPNGEWVLKGNSIRSRRDERFGKRFITEMVAALLDGNVNVVDIYERYKQAIIDRSLPLDELAKRERVTDTTMNSPLKTRLREAVVRAGAHEGEYVWVYQNEDGKYVPLSQAGDRDEDRFYYLERLYKFAQRLKPVLDTYGIVLPRVTKKEFKMLGGNLNERDHTQLEFSYSFAS